MATLLDRIPSSLRSQLTVNKLGPMVAVRVAGMAVTRQLDLDSSDTLYWLRIAYVGVQILALLVWAYVIVKIIAENNTSKISYTPAKSLVARATSVVAAARGQDADTAVEKPKIVASTVRDYDMGHAKAAIKGILRSFVLIGGVHLVLDWRKFIITPLIGIPVALLESKQVQIHILRRAPVGHLARPFEGPVVTEKLVATEKTAKTVIEEKESKVEVIDEKAALKIEESTNGATNGALSEVEVTTEIISEKVSASSVRQRRAPAAVEL